MLRKFIPEIIVFLFALVTRFWNLGYPTKHYFDEVYHVFTAQQMFRGNPAAWEWWNNPPQGFAYEWTHPPLAKEFMVFAISILGDNPFAWRFFSALFGVGSIILIYFISLSLFKDRKIALLSALAASLSGLLLVMSRIGMNDSYFLFFVLLSVLMFLKKRLILLGIFLGLAVSSKWTALFAVLIFLGLYFLKPEKFVDGIKFLLAITLIPFIVYLATYTPFFLGRHSPLGQNLSNFQTFVGLQQQMWWYHTGLKATHSYQSKPIQWVFNLRPVWVFVDYEGEKVANIYTLENPALTLLGILSVAFLAFSLIQKSDFSKLTVLSFYFIFFLPWTFSPRIMFNYHYLASTAFMSIAIGFTLYELLKTKNGKIFLISIFLLLIASFLYFFPLWTGIHIPKAFAESHFWLQNWK